MKQEILLVKIHNGLKDGKSAYEATRKHWRMNKDRHKYIKYVVGLDKKNVVAVFEPSNWFVVNEGSEKGRSFFEGKEATGEIQERIEVSSEILVPNIIHNRKIYQLNRRKKCHKSQPTD